VRLGRRIKHGRNIGYFVDEFFHEAVTDAMSAVDLDASEPAGWYLVGLLGEFTTARFDRRAARNEAGRAGYHSEHRCAHPQGSRRHVALCRRLSSQSR